ncbi:FkbM family methyltransferase [Bradyrhizobium sp. SSBR45G]|uniref:FkbM family methyltransferase n=1 Tax=Bradyrhizobium sp. SSBR45G TaxID=2996008 RepID=UPI0032E9F1B5
MCDIGANKGSFVYWLSRWSAPGRTIAFEPQPDLADGLSRLSQTFSMKNVVVERAAAYSSSGTKEFFIPLGHQPAASLIKQMDLSNEIRVNTIALDDYFSERETISAIKIDVEGAELDVLLGAQRTLARCSPIIVCECDRHLVSLQRMKDTFSFLLDLGYSGRFVSMGRLLPLSSFEPDVHQNTDGDWFWKKKSYSNNFIFQKGT